MNSMSALRAPDRAVLPAVQSSDTNNRPTAHLQTYCQISAATTLALASVVLFGWAFHVPLMTSMDGYGTTKVNTAKSPRNMRP